MAAVPEVEATDRGLPYALANACSIDETTSPSVQFIDPERTTFVTPICSGKPVKGFPENHPLTLRGPPSSARRLSYRTRETTLGFAASSFVPGSSTSE